jgi:hypothetical protein
MLLGLGALRGNRRPWHQVFDKRTIIRYRGRQRTVRCGGHHRQQLL